MEYKDLDRPIRLRTVFYRNMVVSGLAGGSHSRKSKSHLVWLLSALHCIGYFKGGKSQRFFHMVFSTSKKELMIMANGHTFHQPEVNVLLNINL